MEVLFYLILLILLFIFIKPIKKHKKTVTLIISVQLLKVILELDYVKFLVLYNVLKNIRTFLIYK